MTPVSDLVPSYGKKANCKQCSCLSLDDFNPAIPDPGRETGHIPEINDLSGSASLASEKAHWPGCAVTI